MFKEYFIVLQYAPFRHAKWAILECDMVLFSLRNGLYRKLKWAISERRIAFFGLRYRVYQKPVCHGMASDMPDLTFLYISFAKIFCQNKVKKNRKYVTKILPESDEIWREKGRGKGVHVLLM